MAVLLPTDFLLLECALYNCGVSSHCHCSLPHKNVCHVGNHSPPNAAFTYTQMALEIVIIFAAVTGRTLVLPPDTPFYLLGKQENGKKKTKHHGFADFLDLNSASLRREVDMITMKEFLEREGTTDGAPLTNDKLFSIEGGSIGQKIWKSAEQCYYFEKSDRPCNMVYGLLRKNAFVPEVRAAHHCLVFDAALQSTGTTLSDGDILAAMSVVERNATTQFCGERTPVFYRGKLAEAPWIHIRGGERDYRLLEHFYAFLYFPDVAVDHYYKRFVRDFLHYTPTIWCAAGRVLQALEGEARAAGGRDATAPFSSLHVRRGDFQYKKVRISAEDWYKNTRELFRPDEIIYVATGRFDLAVK